MVGGGIGVGEGGVAGDAGFGNGAECVPERGRDRCTSIDDPPSLPFKRNSPQRFGRLLENILDLGWGEGWHNF